MVGEISKGIQRKGVRRIAHVVVLCDEGEIVLENSDPVQPFLFGRV